MTLAQAASFLLVFFGLVFAVGQVFFVLSGALGKITARLFCRRCKAFRGETDDGKEEVTRAAVCVRGAGGGGESGRC